jgi:hypothetical protein
VERDDPDAPPRGARDDHDHRGDARSRARAALGDDVGDRRRGRDRTGDAVQVLPDVEAILTAWHERQITRHLEQLAEARDQVNGPAEQLEAVLGAYACISHQAHGHHNSELAAFVHRDERIKRARHQVHDMIRDLLADCAAAGSIRTDIAPDELASYCLHALTAASSMPSQAAASRLVTVTLAGLRLEKP